MARRSEAAWRYKAPKTGRDGRNQMPDNLTREHPSIVALDSFLAEQAVQGHGHRRATDARLTKMLDDEW